MLRGILQTLAWLGVVIIIVGGLIEVSSLALPSQLMAERGITALVVAGVGAVIAIVAYLADMWINRKP